MKTSAIKHETEKKTWYVTDAKDTILGRLASEISRVLSGKHRSTYTPNFDTGDYVVVLNAGALRVTGKKLTNKLYYRHSSYPGGLKVRSFQQMQKKHPGAVLRLAVKGMLPKNRLARKMLGKLKIYEGNTHPHPPSVLIPLEVRR